MEKGWKTYALGVLFVITSATSGIAYNNAMTRIDSLEATRDAQVQVAQKTAVRLAVLQNSLEEVKISLTNVEKSQNKLSDKIDRLVTNALKDSQRWNMEMDHFSTGQPKK